MGQVIEVTLNQVIEMIIQMINRLSQETGGLTAKTENPRACARWTKINHFLVTLRKHKNKILRKNRNEKRSELGEKRILKDESKVKMFLQTYKSGYLIFGRIISLFLIYQLERKLALILLKISRQYMIGELLE